GGEGGWGADRGLVSRDGARRIGEAARSGHAAEEHRAVAQAAGTPGRRRLHARRRRTGADGGSARRSELGDPRVGSRGPRVHPPRRSAAVSVSAGVRTPYGARARAGPQPAGITAAAAASLSRSAAMNG